MQQITNNIVNLIIFNNNKEINNYIKIKIKINIYNSNNSINFSNNKINLLKLIFLLINLHKKNNTLLLMILIITI